MSELNYFPHPNVASINRQHYNAHNAHTDQLQHWIISLELLKHHEQQGRFNTPAKQARYEENVAKLEKNISFEQMYRALP